MKKIIFYFFLICCSVQGISQEVDNPMFELKQTNFTNELEFQSNPVNHELITVSIYTAEADKRVNSSRIVKQLDIYRGRKIHRINLKELEKNGPYFLEISQPKKGVIFRKKFNKQ